MPPTDLPAWDGKTLPRQDAVAGRRPGLWRRDPVLALYPVGGGRCPTLPSPAVANCIGDLPVQIGRYHLRPLGSKTRIRRVAALSAAAPCRYPPGHDPSRNSTCTPTPARWRSGPSDSGRCRRRLPPHRYPFGPDGRPIPMTTTDRLRCDIRRRSWNYLTSRCSHCRRVRRRRRSAILGAGAVDQSRPRHPRLR